MVEEADIFEIMHTMRAMRRLKPSPVPKEMIDKILDAGIRAPSGQNTQPWAFLVIEDDEGKRFFGDRYHYWLAERFGDVLKITDNTKVGRNIAAARHLAEKMHEVPVIIMAMGLRDWPFKVPKEQRVGLAPPSYGSVYPCVQNMLIACRALGLGASLTTMHQMFEPEIHDYYQIPENYGVVSVIPVGFPSGKFGPVSREPISTKTHYGKWGVTK
ncbi:MAG: nitroreductase family protein [Pseudomonadota bacterium]|nr:nitroreductase family protein [Pseudomonadota bacterium]